MGIIEKKQLFRSVEIVLFNSRTTRVQDKTAHVSSRIAQLHGKPRSSHQKNCSDTREIRSGKPKNCSGQEEIRSD